METIVGVMMFGFAAWMVFNAVSAVGMLVEEYSYPLMGASWRMGVWVLLFACVVLSVFDVALGIYWLSV